MHRIRFASLWACTLWSLVAAASEPLPPPIRHLFVGSVLQPEGPGGPPSLGVVQDADFDSIIIRPSEHVRVTCAAPCGAKVGERLYTFVASAPIRHPVTRKSLGHLTEATGQLTVTEVLNDGFWAQVTSSVMEIERGQRVAQVTTPLVVDVLPKAPTVRAQGRVVAMGRNLLLGREERMLFVDVGTQDGLQVGDVLSIRGRRDTVHPPLPQGARTEAMAQVVLVSVGERVSTALVADGLWEVALGDTVFAAP